MDIEIFRALNNIAGLDDSILYIDRPYLHSMNEMDEDSLQQLFAGLVRSTNITRVYFTDSAENAAGEEGFNAHNFFALLRFRQLCAVLGAVSTLSSATFIIGGIDGDPTGRTINHALRSLRQVSRLVITGGVPVANDVYMFEVGSAIYGHSSLQKITIENIPTHAYRVILPALRTVQLLERVHLGANFGSDPMAPPDVLALAEVMRIDRPIDVSLSYLKFSSNESYHELCEAIALTSIRSLDIKVCEMEDGHLLANAITRSSIRKILISTSHEAFFTTLSGDIGGMSQLEDISIQVGMTDDIWPVINLIRNAFECPRLKRLCLTLYYYPESLDLALAECIHQLPHLETLILSCPYIGVDIHTARRLFRPVALAEALKTNYTVKNISFLYIPTREAGQTLLEIDDIPIMLRLNAAGRGYMKTAPTNKRAGLRVLEEVMDSLDCLFYHLRENPSLFE
jgi:hypothetical protein